MSRRYRTGHATNPPPLVGETKASWSVGRAEPLEPRVLNIWVICRQNDYSRAAAVIEAYDDVDEARMRLAVLRHADTNDNYYWYEQVSLMRGREVR